MTDPAPPTDEELARRYHDDAQFHAVVHIAARVFGNCGWRDEDGVWHEGPTSVDVRRTAEFLAELERNGLTIGARS